MSRASVTPKAAAERLSDAAVAKGMKWGNKFWYEEDVDVAILVLELPDVFPDASQRDALMALSDYRPEYLLATGRTPDPSRYAHWQERQEEDRLRRARSPDLVTAPQSVGPGVIKVWTADGAQHLVTEASYSDRAAHRMRLSRMEVVR